VLNLFSRISPSPAVLRRTGDPVGARTDEWICNRLTASGQPRHPLYRRGDAPLLRLTWCTSQGLEHPEDTAAPLIAASPCLPSPAAMPSIST
jgi:hypothetical protein